MNTSDQSIEQYSWGYRLRIIGLIFALMSAIGVFIGLMLPSLLDNLIRYSQSHIYVSASSWDLPVLVSIPCFIVLIYALTLRLVGKASEQNMNRCFNIAILFAGIALVVRLVYGFATSHYLTQNGYTQCWYYSSPSVWGANVWVRQPEYCVENAGKVRMDVLNWMDSLPNNGRGVPPAVIESKVNKLIADWEAQDKKNFPHLYQ